MPSRKHITKATKVYAKIEALESMAALFGNFNGFGEDDFDGDEYFKDMVYEDMRKIANQLQGRADRLAEKYGLVANKFYY